MHAWSTPADGGTARTIPAAQQFGSPAGSFPAPRQQASAAPGAQGQWGPFRGNPPTNSAILEGAGFGLNYWGGDGTTRVSGPWGIAVLGVPGLSLIVVQFWNV